MTAVDISVFEAPKSNRPQCGIKRVLAMLDAKKLSLAQEALSAPKEKYPNTQVARVLKEWSGMNIDSSTVGRHRLKGCSCE